MVLKQVVEIIEPSVLVFIQSNFKPNLKNHVIQFHLLYGNPMSMFFCITIVPKIRS